MWNGELFRIPKSTFRIFRKETYMSKKLMLLLAVVGVVGLVAVGCMGMGGMMGCGGTGGGSHHSSNSSDSHADHQHGKNSADADGMDCKAMGCDECPPGTRCTPDNMKCKKCKEMMEKDGTTAGGCSMMKDEKAEGSKCEM